MDEQPERKFDVAISFRWDPDEGAARALYELLRDRLEVFFSEDRPEEFVGKDGEESFGFIFRDECRIVVIFYRPDWGETTFTRAEEAAVKQRAYRDGYDFTIWVPMGDATKPPPYVPQQRIWADWEALGAHGLAAIVEERVRDSGRKVREASPIDEIKRLARSRALEQAREAFRCSQEAEAFFFEEVARLRELSEASAAAFAEADELLRFTISDTKNGRGVTVKLQNYEVELSWIKPYNNVFKGTKLEVAHHQYVRRSPYNERERRGAQAYEVDLDSTLAPRWKTGRGEYVRTEDLVQEAVSDLALRYARSISPPQGGGKASGGLVSFR